jgi:hypothetical protein
MCRWSWSRSDPENFYEGHRPSLIRAPIDKYPNVARRGLSVQRRILNLPERPHGQFNVLLYVEIMCKSIDDEETVNKRIVRTVEAVNAVMTDDKTSWWSRNRLLHRCHVQHQRLVHAQGEDDLRGPMVLAGRSTRIRGPKRLDSLPA